ncbi:hypothetical protein ATE84_4469 [Aquimarina sp. MAR_2010_214]|uniref:hypothetical protein n=1 Tax=Aquimarina sp. MAR_2010_214 TaxID=1250026 RepID=UPI000C7029F4|nr:hypothetical protein [Aquimarina sp. MAR_2010_214]PKV52357.1 hypothetical protein ATE84_4469 [Aquimarina sp. MAR_2010_214]
MKKTTLLLFCILSVTSTTIAQDQGQKILLTDQTISKITHQVSENIKSELKKENDQDIIGKYYEFTEKIKIFKFEIEIELDKKKPLLIQDIVQGENYIFNDEVLLIKPGWVFNVIKIQENLIIIQIVNQKDYKENFYAISRNQFLGSTKIYEGDRPKRSFVSSAITIPIKIRFGDHKNLDEKTKYFDFEGNINVGVTAGFRDRINKTGKNYISYLGGLSIASTKITPETAEIDSETNASILTPFLGILYEYNDFQIGAFIGWDHIGGKLGKSWVYQGNAWIGFGIGYNIFTSTDSNGS